MATGPRNIELFETIDPIGQSTAMDQVRLFYGGSIIKTPKLTLCTVAIALLISPIPDSAQFGGIFGGKSKAA